jgi:large subunit ribosomal protein L25
MERTVLHATRRTVTGKQVGQLRRDGKLPAVLYGHNVESTPITLDLRQATRSMIGLTGSSLITIDVDGVEHAALLREVQRDFIRGTLLHVDFQVVSLTEKIRAQVPVVLEGVAPAVKTMGAAIVHNVNEVEVEALPQDLVNRFTVDISSIAAVGDAIYVRDLNIPQGVVVLTDPDEVVVVATAAAAEPVEEGEEAVAAGEEPEVIEKGKKEEEEEE